MLEFTSRREMRGQSFSPLQSSSAAVTGQRLHPSMVQDCHGMNSNYLATQIVTLESPGQQGPQFITNPQHFPLCMGSFLKAPCPADQGADSMWVLCTLGEVPIPRPLFEALVP